MMIVTCLATQSTFTFAIFNRHQSLTTDSRLEETVLAAMLSRKQTAAVT